MLSLLTEQSLTAEKEEAVNRVLKIEYLDLICRGTGLSRTYTIFIASIHVCKLAVYDTTLCWSKHSSIQQLDTNATSHEAKGCGDED